MRFPTGGDAASCRRARKRQFVYIYAYCRRAGWNPAPTVAATLLRTVCNAYCLFLNACFFAFKCETNDQRQIPGGICVNRRFVQLYIAAKVRMGEALSFFCAPNYVMRGFFVPVFSPLPSGAQQRIKPLWIEGKNRWEVL